MISFIIYLIIGGVAGWIFKLVAGAFETIVMLPFGIGTDKMTDNIESKPKLFFTVLALKNTVIGLANALMIFFITIYFLQRWGGNFWLYVILSCIWSLYIISINSAFPLSTMVTSTGTLVLLWLGFGAFAWIITGVLTLLVSLPYYFGRINTIQEQGNYERYI